MTTFTPVNEERQGGAELASALEAVTATDSGSWSARMPTSLSDGFADSSLGVVRSQHALEAFDNPDDFVIFEYQDIRMFVVSQAKDTPNGAFVLLVLAYEIPGNLLVPAAYRLYGSQQEVQELAKDARAAFQAFLERYALPYQAGDRRVLFLPVVTVRGENPIATLGLSTDTPFVFSGMTRRSEDAVTWAWPFFVDSNRYMADIKSHQR